MGLGRTLIGVAETTFFQTAAAVLAVLLLTGVVGDLREAEARLREADAARRPQEHQAAEDYAEEHQYSRADALMLYASFVVSGILVVGAMAAFYALRVGTLDSSPRTVPGHGKRMS